MSRRDLEDLQGHIEAAAVIIERMRAQAVALESTAPPSVAAPAEGLTNPSAFFAHLRVAKVLGSTLEQGEIDGCNAILEACEGWPLSWPAYALATAMVETNGTMKPVREAYWLDKAGQEAWARKMYDIRGARPDKARELGNTTPGDGFKYAGRGYVQITGKTNYERAQAKTGSALVVNPDLAMVPDTAALIMRKGMEEGWFTGKSLRDYLPAEATREQFKNARRVINGQDRADEIAGFAVEFQKALKAGGWR